MNVTVVVECSCSSKGEPEGLIRHENTGGVERSRVARDGMGRSAGISPDHDMAGFDGQAGVRMTLLGNFVEMSGQGENDPFIKNKRSERSMRGENQRPHQEGNGSRTASHAVHVVHTPPRDALFSLFSCPDKISQQSQELVVGKHACGAKTWRVERATSACLIAPPLSPPSARTCRERAKAGPYARSPRASRASEITTITVKVAHDDVERWLDSDPNGFMKSLLRTSKIPCCHPERSEGSLRPASQTLGCAQGDRHYSCKLILALDGSLEEYGGWLLHFSYRESSGVSSDNGLQS